MKSPVFLFILRGQDTQCRSLDWRGFRALWGRTHSWAQVLDCRYLMQHFSVLLACEWTQNSSSELVTVTWAEQWWGKRGNRPSVTAHLLNFLPEEVIWGERKSHGGNHEQICYCWVLKCHSDSPQNSLNTLVQFECRF